MKKLLLFSCLCITSQFALSQDWKLEKNKDGITIETRFLDGWAVKQYRATMFVNATLDQVTEAYRNAEQRKQYMTRSVEVSNLEVRSQNEIVTYNHGDAPWPVSDRDNITLSVFSQPKSNTVLITMQSLPDFIPHKKGVVRVNRSEGFWEFTDMGNGRIRIIQQSVADIGGSVPDWVVNSTIIEGPFEVFQAMKRVIEGTKS